MHGLLKHIATPILLALLLTSASLQANNPLVIPDGTVKLVYFFEEDDKYIVSDIRNNQFVELRRKAQEQLLEKAVANQVVVLVTNQRYVAYSALTTSWHTLKRRASEKFISVEAADFSAFLVTNKRLVSFNGQTGTWAEQRR